LATQSVVVSIRGLTKNFGATKAADSIDLDIRSGEFITLLGPSGSGKTTVLRMIAGFERPDAGTITIDGQDVTNLPPYERNVNTVFQDYALFPNMTVLANIEYGLKVKKVAKDERRARALEALASVQLAGFENRKPSQLSGGQRQRVALARALVNRPKVLLLDEPLGALDLKLREQMQLELKSMQRDLGITFIFVTHDQEEAMTMSDRIAVFNAGKIEQLATPEVIYEKPATEFVTGFVGQTNKLTVDGKSIRVRPEHIAVAAKKTAGANSISGKLIDIIFAGAITRYVVKTDDAQTVIATNSNAKLEVGDSVVASWSPEKEFRA
jgi:putative spermidine/putrescine transport system ATP-binding protein